MSSTLSCLARFTQLKAGTSLTNVSIRFGNLFCPNPSSSAFNKIPLITEEKVIVQGSLSRPKNSEKHSCYA